MILLSSKWTVINLREDYFFRTKTETRPIHCSVKTTLSLLRRIKEKYEKVHMYVCYLAMRSIEKENLLGMLKTSTNILPGIETPFNLRYPRPMEVDISVLRLVYTLPWMSSTIRHASLHQVQDEEQ